MIKKLVIRIVIFLIILLVVGGSVAASQGIQIISDSFFSFFPIFKPLIIQSFKDYLTSARFITAFFIFLLSSVGIYLTAKKRKYLYLVVSIIVDVVTLFSIISNLARCS